MAEIRWTRESENWLRDIHDFISAESPRAAANLALSIYQRVQILKSQPNIGYRYHRHEGFNIRVLLYGHYRIAYLLKEDGNIDILGIFLGALDMDKYLFNN